MSNFTRTLSYTAAALGGAAMALAALATALPALAQSEAQRVPGVSRAQEPGILSRMAEQGTFAVPPAQFAPSQFQQEQQFQPAPQFQQQAQPGMQPAPGYQPTQPTFQTGAVPGNVLDPRATRTDSEFYPGMRTGTLGAMPVARNASPSGAGGLGAGLGAGLGELAPAAGGAAGMTSGGGYAMPGVVTNRTLPSGQTQAPHLSGGIGGGERERLDAEARAQGMNLKLVFVAKDGAYLSDANVRVTGAGGETVLDTVSEGPFFYARVPNGKHTVHATHPAGTATKQVTTGNAMREVYFRW